MTSFSHRRSSMIMLLRMKIAIALLLSALFVISCGVDPQPTDSPDAAVALPVTSVVSTLTTCKLYGTLECRAFAACAPHCPECVEECDIVWADRCAGLTGQTSAATAGVCATELHEHSCSGSYPAFSTRGTACLISFGGGEW